MKRSFQVDDIFFIVKQCRFQKCVKNVGRIKEIKLLSTFYLEKISLLRKNSRNTPKIKYYNFIQIMTFKYILWIQN